jgi:predicted methyltransferase
MNFRAIAAMAGVILACAGFMPAGAVSAGEQPGAHADAALAKAIRSPLRSPQLVARDRFRHPGEVLSFFGLKPGMTVVEIWPSGGYWTEILAPYAKATDGHYIAAVPSEKHPLPAKFDDKTVYGDLTTTVFNDKSGPLVPPGTADLVLTFRNVHNWMGKPGMPEKAMADFYAALKPGGVLGLVEHRSDPRPMAKDASDGYVSTAYVVALAQKAGFKLEDRSEINANPRDTKDYPFGVWTLPPTRLSGPEGGPQNPAFDHSKYDAIGESDRMTLRFRKPE